MGNFFRAQPACETTGVTDKYQCASGNERGFAEATPS